MRAEDIARLPVLGMGLAWQSLAPGPLGRTLRRTVTEADLVGFIGVTGMVEAIFIDATFEGGAISGRPVPAALTHCLIEGLLFQSVVQGVGLALLELELKPLAPVRVGDTIWATIVIVDVRPTSRENRAVVESVIDVFNQRDEPVLQYRVKRLVKGQDSQPDSRQPPPLPPLRLPDSPSSG